MYIKAKIHRPSLKHLTGSLSENVLVSQLEEPSLGSLTEFQLKKKNSRRSPSSLSLYDGMFWPPYQSARSGSLSCPSCSCHPARPLSKAGSHCWVSPFIYLSPARPWFSGGLFHLTQPLLAGMRQCTVVLPTCLEHSSSSLEWSSKTIPSQAETEPESTPSLSPHEGMYRIHSTALLHFL